MISRLIASYFLLTSWTIAQTINGNIEGRVLDSEGQPIPGTNVVVSGPNLVGTRGAATNETGFFRILALPSGPYTAMVEHVSYQPQAITGIRVSLGATISLPEIRLQSRILEADEVLVLEERPVLDATSTSLGENLTPAQIENLPLDRSYQSIIKLLPQVNESYYGDGVSIMGTTGLENKYFINGVDITDPFRGGNSTSLPYNFVREIQVRTGAYEAEYRGSLGGLVTVDTYAGGNDFSGQLYGFFTNNNFSSKSRPSRTALPEKYSQYDVGGSIGGPILRNKLWFYAAYNPNVAREDVPVEGLGNITDQQTTHIFASKLSWRIDNHNDLQLTAFGNRISGQEVLLPQNIATYHYSNPDLVLYRTAMGTYSIMASGLHALNNNILLESFVSWTLVKNILKPDQSEHQDEVYFWNDFDQTVSGGSLLSSDDASSEISAGLKSTLISGDHTLKTGLEFWYLEHTSDFWTRVLHTSTDSLYIFEEQQRKGTFGQILLGWFLQDSWQITSRLRLNAGVRWDPQFLRASDGKISQKFLNQIAPRFGMVYLPTGSESDKITFSAGRFYQMLSMYIQEWYNLANTRIHWMSWTHDPRLDPSGGSTILDWTGSIQAEVAGMQGQHYDEVTFGYERILFQNVRLSIQGAYRTLREGIEDGADLATGNVYFGNPGSPPLQAWPKMRREYSAVEITLNQFGSGAFNYLVTYVLSRTYGNYPGIFDPHWSDDRANATSMFDFPELLINATGLLPNDRTHVFKFFGSCRPISSFTVGAFLVWESGVPLSEYGGHYLGYPLSFLSQRGTNGRTPALWDLSIRSVCELDRVFKLRYRTRLILDIFHVGSPRQAVDYDQIHYFAVDENGNQINPNPQYLQPIQFQPPMSVRLGMEISF